MFQRSKVLLLIAPLIALSACGSESRGLESVHQPLVERTDYVFDVATSGNGLASGESARLAGWMASLRLGYGDRVAIDDPNGGYGRDTTRDAVSAQAARYGLLLSDDAPVTTGPLAAGTVRVVVSRMRAFVPGCPDHSRVSGNDLNANTASNYGCATNSNLAAMLARPEDLVRGQPGADTSDPAVSFKAIDVMRKATPTGAGGLKAETTKGGN